MPDKITEVYVFAAIDPVDNNEGIPAFMGKDGIMMPMLCADVKRIQSLLPIAEAMAAAGVTIRLLRFRQLEVVSNDILTDKVDLEKLRTS